MKILIMERYETRYFVYVATSKDLQSRNSQVLSIANRWLIPILEHKHINIVAPHFDIQQCKVFALFEGTTTTLTVWEQCGEFLTSLRESFHYVL